MVSVTTGQTCIVWVTFAFLARHNCFGFVVGLMWAKPPSPALVHGQCPKKLVTLCGLRYYLASPCVPCLLMPSPECVCVNACHLWCLCDYSWCRRWVTGLAMLGPHSETSWPQVTAVWLNLCCIVCGLGASFVLFDATRHGVSVWSLRLPVGSRVLLPQCRLSCWPGS